MNVGKWKGVESKWKGWNKGSAGSPALGPEGYNSRGRVEGGRAHSGAMLRPARREKDAEDDREDEKEDEEGMDRISLRGHACIHASSWCPLSAAELELFPRASRR